MKKLIALILAMVMMLSFVACRSDDDVRGEVSTSPDENNEEVKNDKEDKEEDEVPEFSMGSAGGSKYENSFLGIGCELSGDWTFYNDSQIKALNNVTEEAAGEEYAALMAEADILTDMYATHSNGLDSINVNLEKIGIVNAATYDVKAAYEASVSTITDSFANMGYENTKSEIVTVTVDGEEFTALRTTASIAGINMYQISVGMVRGAYAANVTVTTFYEDSVQEILDCFYMAK